MECPECYGKLLIKSSYTGDDGNVYRQRECETCYRIFRSIETVTEYTGEFDPKWAKGRRDYINRVRARQGADPVIPRNFKRRA